MNTVLEDREAVGRALSWLGVPDVAAGLSQVDESLRTQRSSDATSAEASEDSDPPRDVIAVFDELYERVRSSRGFDEAFIERLNRVDYDLAPQLADARKALQQARRERSRAIQGQGAAGAPA
jgi:hypothetical protein